MAKGDSCPGGLSSAANSRILGAFSRAEKILLLLFVLTLPFIQPQIRYDGIGYYAWARSLLIDHNLQFQGDWKVPGTLPSIVRADQSGRTLSISYRTRTGHLVNHFSVGPAILWAPFLIATHLSVLALDHAGYHIPPDGFSRPYFVTIALATAFYAFLGLWISFRLARSYLDERWAFLATLGIWFGSSLPVYMYVEPAWSHAMSEFVVALFIWYWLRTGEDRDWIQWMAFGAIAGLMMDVYYLNAILLLLPALELARRFFHHRESVRGALVKQTLGGAFVFFVGLFVSFLPNLITKKIIFGSYMDWGYAEHWHWNSPAFLKVCFSPQHGLFRLTPILILAVAGLFLFRKYDRILGFCLPTVFAAYLYAVGSYEGWGGGISFGNRFFVSLTPLFILGLAALCSEFARLWKIEVRATMRAAAILTLLISWNLGLVFQWGTGLLSDSPVSWDEIVYNEFRVVPGEIVRSLQSHFTQL